MKTLEVDVAIIGAGPAGLAAAVSAKDAGANVLLIEREERAGGILKQCIHDGFGLIRFKEKLTGPEYAYREIVQVKDREIPLMLNTFAGSLEQRDGFYCCELTSPKGIFNLKARAVVLAMGCRERTAKQVFIHGTRPSGVYTAGQAQYYINIQGFMPVKKCVILGSGDIGLIMARRLTLEGAQVEGVYEVKSQPSGLSRNIVQCLMDYNIPLHLSTTVTKIHGAKRVEAVTVASVDEKMQPIPGSERTIECDSLVLSVGLIPENDIVDALGTLLDGRTKGPVVDQNLMTLQTGVFSCGNALHVSDLADYVSQTGEKAGICAAAYALESKKSSISLSDTRNLIEIKPGANVFYTVPQRIDLNGVKETEMYFRSSKTLENASFVIKNGEKEIFRKKYRVLRPPEMEKIRLDLSKIDANSAIEAVVEPAADLK